MIDLHSHILPGLDDGAATLEESREIAELTVADGVTTIAATPHVREDWPTTPEAMEAAVARVRDDLRAAEIGLEVVTGGEVGLDRLSTLSPDERRRFSLAGGGRYLLVESPYTGWPLGLESAILELDDQGFTAVLAHPERNVDVQRDLGRIVSVVEAGALVQVTAASLEGKLGRASREAAFGLLEQRLVHLVASDAHTAAIREGGLSAASRALRDPGLARYLMDETPAAIIAGEDVAEPRRSRRKSRLRRA